MNSGLKLMFAAGAMAMVAGLAFAEEDEQKVELNALPAAVRATAEANAEGGKLTEAELETEGGQKIYSVEVKKADGTEIEIEIATDGKLIKVEKEDDDDEEKSKEEKIELSAAPQPVQDAINKALAGGALGELVKETEHGGTVYEAEYKVADVEHSLKLAANGAVLESENVISTSTLAAEVTAAVQKKFPGAKIVEAEDVTERFYELEIQVTGKKREVKVSAAGQIMGGEDDDEDEEDDD